MYRRIFFRPERCMVCQSCVLACQLNSLGISDVTEIPGDGKPVRRMTLMFSRGTPWAWKCQQCTSAPCVEACVSGSLRHGEGEIGVIHDRETCVGCESCLLACPFDAVIPNEEEGVVAKCNLCPEEDIPPCVKACQSGALVHRETTLFARDRSKTFLRAQRVHHEGE